MAFAAFRSLKPLGNRRRRFVNADDDRSVPIGRPAHRRTRTGGQERNGVRQGDHLTARGLSAGHRRGSLGPRRVTHLRVLNLPVADSADSVCGITPQKTDPARGCLNYCSGSLLLGGWPTPSHNLPDRRRQGFARTDGAGEARSNSRWFGFELFHEPQPKVIVRNG